jgi:Lar family restriction alleviation protein
MTMTPTNQRAVELAPCPFCGSSDVRMTNHGRIGTGMDHRGETVFTLGCYMCGANYPGMYEEYGRKKLIEKWNRRAPGWRPISEAPRDGTRVLISDNGQAFIARYWMNEWRVGTLPGDLAYPDGWMPLPAGIDLPPPPGE